MKRWRLIEDRDVTQVIALWDRCKLTRPWNDPVTDLDFARRGPASAVLVWDEKDQIIASVMVGHDGHRGTLYYVGVIQLTVTKVSVAKSSRQQSNGWPITAFGRSTYWCALTTGAPVISGCVSGTH